MFGFGDALSWPSGHRIHLRITSRPYPTGEWAKRLHELTPAPLASLPSWSDHMVDTQLHLRNQTMAEKEIYLGVRIKSRPPTYRILSGVLRHPSSSEHARLLPEIERINEVVAPAGIGGPARDDRRARVVAAPLGRPWTPDADRPLPAAADAWESDDLVSFTDRVEYDVEPLGRTVHVTGRGSADPIERHVAVMSVGRKLATMLTQLATQRRAQRSSNAKTLAVILR